MIKYSKSVIGIVRNWTKLKTQSFLLSGPDVSSVYSDFLGGPFYHSLSKNKFTKQKNKKIIVKERSLLRLLTNFSQEYVKAEVPKVCVAASRGTAASSQMPREAS